MASKEFEATIAEVLGKLEKNPEWEALFAGYADYLLKRQESILARKKLFHEFPPLRFYLRISDIKKAESYTLFDVRYRGQSVASMRVCDDKVRIDRTNPNNGQDFEMTLAISESVDWRSKEASELRKHFRDLGGNRRCEREHNIENLLITEFSKRKSEGKELIGIQPVKYCGFRFVMKTPLKASEHGHVEYAGRDGDGGGIDILARTGHGDATFLTVVEVKNENKPDEPAAYAVEQGIAYAVFLIKLLRSKSGADWFRLFGFTRQLPEKLKIRVACAMPHNPKGEDDISFAGQRLAVGDDSIECHYIYFKYDNDTNPLHDFSTSL
ncbi:MAG: hypothetical protein FWF60_03365 [Oscillospiraceae bacterium]|nr:hypothetical protein [Oscillospiraceae bacterium]